MPLDHCSARVACRQRPILRNGTSSLTIICIRDKSKKGICPGSLGMEHLEGALVAQALSGPMVQCTNVGSQLPNRQNRQVRAFGQVLAQQAIGIFIGASFPSMIRMGEEDMQA